MDKKKTKESRMDARVVMTELLDQEGEYLEAQYLYT